jgi:hypothetical protein
MALLELASGSGDPLVGRGFWLDDGGNVSSDAAG